MTAITAVTAADRAARTAHVRRAAVRAAVRYVSHAHLVFAGIFWALFGLVALLVPVFVHQAGGTMSGGVLHATGYSARWVAFSLAIGTTYSLAAVHLAAGGTRRSLYRGVIAGAGIAGLAYGLAFGLARLGERALFDGFGWTWVAPTGLSGAADLGGDALGALGEAVAITGYALIGAGISVSFLGVRRLGLAIAAVLVALVTAAAVETASRTGTGGQTIGRWVAQHWLPAGGPGIWIGVAAGLVVLALAAGWLRLRLRHLQLRPPV